MSFVRTFSTLCLVVACLGFVSCADNWYERNAPRLHNRNVYQFTGDASKNGRVDGLSPRSAAMLNDYKVSSGDRLRVSVFGQADLSGEHIIDGSGNISIPLLSHVNVEGKATPEIEKLLEARLAAGYLRDPDVSVEVLTFRPFFILGQVTNAGQYPYVSGMTIQNAIAIGGGYTPRANQSEVIVNRTVGTRIKARRMLPSARVEPGDTIYVSERWF